MLAPLAAVAQEPSGFDAHGFVLHAHDGDLRDPLTLNRPGPWNQGDWWVSGLLEYADRPLVQVVAPSIGSDTPDENILLDQLFGLNLNTGAGIHDRLRLDAGAPVFFTSVGQEGRQNPAMGDLRVTATGALLRPQHLEVGGGLGVGAAAHLDLPTGDSTIFLGQPGVAGGLGLLATYEGAWYTFSGELGAQLNPKAELDNLENADQLLLGAAVNVLPGPDTGITLESHFGVPFAAADQPGTGLPGELLLSLRQRVGASATITVGGATAVTPGAGAARFRTFAGVTIGQVEPARAPDHDALLDAVIHDLCPGNVETSNGWRDDDGCPDELGALMVRATYKTQDVPTAALSLHTPDGERRTRVSDRPTLRAVPGSMIRAEAAAPDLCLVGEASTTATESAAELVIELRQHLLTWLEVAVVDPAGVPVPDPMVRLTSPAAPSCVPDTPATASPGTHVVRNPTGVTTVHLLVEAPGFKVFEQDVSVAADGTRVTVRLETSRVVLKQDRIEILDKVFFETNKAVIKPASFGLLNDVAAVILAHPEVGRVQVEGHTDDQGNDAYNLKLSHARAESVRSYLIQRGVAADRLDAAGFGESLPLETNRTEAGRSVNRRVEFKLIDPAPGETHAPKP